MKKFICTTFPLIIFLSFILIRCNNEGMFGHSKNKNDAKVNGSPVRQYLPNKANFKLLDGTEIQIDTAWTEVSFTFKNNKRLLDTTFGYHFSIPFKKEVAGSFTFSFRLADTLNRVFTNGMDENIAQLCPRNLYEKMTILLEQKNPDTTKGWTSPIISDTIVFTMIK